MKRREFLTLTGLMTVSGFAPAVVSSCSPASASKMKVDDCYDTDVLVIGGGPAGVCAAIAAAREGVRVMVVETGGCLGGMATRGLVGPFMTCYDTTGEQMIIKGIFEEIIDRMVEIDGAIHPKDVRSGTPFSAWITAGHDHCTPFEPEAMKFVLDQMCKEAGVKVLFHSTFVSPIMNKDRIEGAVVMTKAGLRGVSAKVVIDSTGDGDVAYRCGVPCSFGNPETGRVQPSSTFFHINNVDSERLQKDVEAHLHEFRKVNGVSYRALHWRVAEAEAAGEWDIARKSVNIYRGVKPDQWAVNCVRVANVNATDPESMSAAEVEGRRQVQELMHFFHKYVPGCENATLMASGSTLGIRESRHIEGDYVLTVEDILSGTVFEDSILLTSSSVDIHGKGGNMSTEYKTVENGRWYGVPYRCLLPKKVEGLLVAGRCLSATSDAAGAVRVMPPVMAMGQAAGTAAAIAVKEGQTPREIDVTTLVSTLKDRKVFLG